MDPLTILFLAANPADQTRLALPREAKRIKKILRSTDYRAHYRVEQEWEVEASELPGKLMQFRPSILHFSGHGDQTGALIFQNSEGNSETAAPETIAKILGEIGENVKCVFLNACFSERQAKIIAKEVGVVIGMSDAVGDADATVFAEHFYQALGYGKNLQTAFNVACAAIDLAQLPDKDVPKIISRPGLDPSRINLLHDRGLGLREGDRAHILKDLTKTSASDSIRRAVEDDELICLVGPSIFGPDSKKNLLTELAHQIVAKHPQFFNKCNYNDLDFFLISELLVASHERGVDELVETVQEFLDSTDGRDLCRSPLLEAVANLPISHYVYFGFDDALINAIKRNRFKNPIDDYYFPIGEMKSIEEKISPVSPLVFNLFGRITQSTRHAILTESQLHDALPLLGGSTPCWPSQLVTKMRSIHTSSLFLGIRLHRWYNRFLLGVYSHARKNRESVAFETKSVYEKAIDQKEVVLYLDNNISRVRFVDIDNNRSELIELLASLGIDERHPSVMEKRAQPVAIYLSYAPNNIESARQLRDTLKAVDVRVRCNSTLAKNPEDAEGFETGLQTTEQLKNIDYFVPLISEEVASRKKTNVSDELAIANSAREIYRPDEQFVFPVRESERTSLVHDLDHHQYNLQSAVEMQALIGKLLRKVG